MISPKMLSKSEAIAGTDHPQLSDPEAIIMGSDSAVLTEIALAMYMRARDLHLSKAMHLLTVGGEIADIRSSLLATVQAANRLFGPHFMDGCIRSAVANPVHNGSAAPLLAKGAIPYRIVEHQQATAVIIDNRPRTSK